MFSSCAADVFGHLKKEAKKDAKFLGNALFKTFSVSLSLIVLMEMWMFKYDDFLVVLTQMKTKLFGMWYSDK